MRLVWAFLAGWVQCVWQIHDGLGGSWRHAIVVTTRKHCGMARFLWQVRSW